ncbi:MAG: hypothetical protein H6659_05665 [Ardenticatenaceae bacterium]|nr:hypothetical protein [Ardenticatenaceae bacterium]
MRTPNKENSAPLPGVWQTIAAGFDLTSKHLWLAVLPIILDCFLWLGPRLSGRPIIEGLASMIPSDPAVGDLSGQLLALAPRTNLFTSLSVPLVGLPALMVGATPEKTPFTPRIVELNSAALWLGLYVIFSLVGVLLTAVYFTLIAREVGRAGGSTALTAPALLSRMGHLWLQFLVLGMLFIILGFIIYLPLLPISLILFLVSSALGLLALFMGPVLLLWVTIYLFFAPHGMALHGRSLYQAALESVQIVRGQFIPALGLLLAVFIIRNLLASILLLADDGSWLTLASILGYAFVTTSLVTATFIFYRDRYLALFVQGPHPAHPTLEQTS